MKTGLGVTGVLIERVADITGGSSSTNEGEASGLTTAFAGEVKIRGYADTN
jgi:hypothetical protein